VGNRFLEVASTPAVVSARLTWDGRDRYAAPPDSPTTNDRLGPAESSFLAERDGFYLASVSETGWPYVQFRGGPPGFLHVLGPTTLGYADYRGNRQYLTMGNTAVDDRVALFVVDHLRRRRLKLLGHLTVVDDPAFLAAVTHPATNAVVERAVRIEVEAFDWNCPQHLTVRFTEAEVTAAVAPLRARIAALEQELARARAGN
jgi:predicted pyridoxine 5'-phosphate oxidase superfamily flavin-nucleotide-binding protein